MEQDISRHSDVKDIPFVDLPSKARRDYIHYYASIIALSKVFQTVLIGVSKRYNLALSNLLHPSDNMSADASFSTLLHQFSKLSCLQPDLQALLTSFHDDIFSTYLCTLSIPTLLTCLCDHYDSIIQKVSTQRKKDLGQFYSPWGVIQFMWRRLLQEEKWNGKVTMLDPSCGLGGFVMGYASEFEKYVERMGEEIPGEELGTKFREFVSGVYAIELDSLCVPFAKCNIVMSLLPIVGILKHRGICTTIPRIKLIQCDTLLLDQTHATDSFVRDIIAELRDPKALTFNYIVTNPVGTLCSVCGGSLGVTLCF
jgi:hypothetical protein